VVVAELALPAQIDHLPIVGRGDLRTIPVVLVDAVVKHEVERGAQAVTPPAPITQLGDALEFLIPDD
jgi:hypothetical protein